MLDPVIIGATAGAIAAGEILPKIADSEVFQNLRNRIAGYRKEAIDECWRYREPTEYELVLGYDPESADQIPIYADMKKNPHVLVSGLSQQGKSSMIEYALRGKNVILLNCFDDDFKRIEGAIRVNETDMMLKTLEDLIQIRENRDPIYVVVDEMLQLVIDKKKEVSDLLIKLLAKAAHKNIYIIGITQSAEKDVVKCKHLFNTRVCFRVVDESSYKVVLGYNPELSILRPRYFYYLTDKPGIGKTYELPLQP